MLVEYAKSELERVDLEYDGMIKEAVLEIVGLFAGQGHSGGSAVITLGVAERLLRFQPLTPLTGGDSEWTEVTEGTWQSKRCPSVFKDAEGKAWDIDLPPESDGDGGASWRTITFPYEPGQTNA
jgi:hypothetical protein